MRVVGQLLGGDRLLAHLLGLGEHLEVARQARGDAERQALGGGGLEAWRVPGQWLVEAHGAHSTEHLAQRAGRRSRARAPPRRRRRPPGSAPRSAGAGAGSSGHVDLLELELAVSSRTSATAALRLVAQVAAGLAVEGQLHARRAWPAGVQRQVARGRPAARRSARPRAIIAALSVHSSSGGRPQPHAELRRTARPARPAARSWPPRRRRCASRGSLSRPTACASRAVSAATIARW